jgi:hypothetical protein
MKKLLLALLVSGTAIFAAGQPSPASADCIHHRIFYYETSDKSGSSCGYSWVYCNAPTYHVGCTTSYYTIVSGCICP